MSTTFFVISAAALVVAFIVDKVMWRRKPREALVGMASGTDWRRWKAGLIELKRRGEETAIYIPHIAQYLISESQVEREAARLTLSSFFPEVRAQLIECGYKSGESSDNSKAKLAALFARYASAGTTA